MDNLNEIKETLKAMFRAAVNNNKEIKVSIDNEVNNDKEIKILNGIKNIIQNCKQPLTRQNRQVLNGLKRIINSLGE